RPGRHLRIRPGEKKPAVTAADRSVDQQGSVPASQWRKASGDHPVSALARRGGTPRAGTRKRGIQPRPLPVVALPPGGTNDRPGLRLLLQAEGADGGDALSPVT